MADDEAPSWGLDDGGASTPAAAALKRRKKCVPSPLLVKHSFLLLSVALAAVNLSGLRQHLPDYMNIIAEPAGSSAPMFPEKLIQRISGESESLAFLFDKLANMTVFDEMIVMKEEEQRCARYGWLLRDPPRRRRIFHGSPVADDSWHPFGIAAMESFGVYHHVAFVESGRTQNNDERALRFTNGSDDLAMLQSGMFGPHTKVTIDYFVGENWTEKAPAYLREMLHRNEILKRWRDEGMAVDDIGLLTDVDESFTRDFLRAVQICDVPVLRPGQSCQKPKILAAGLAYEGSPNCLTHERRIYHPDMILGECIEFIGNKTKHPPVPLEERDHYGWRIEYDPNDKELAAKMPYFPSWNAIDFRMTSGGDMYYGIRGENTGYHAHNFFMSEEALRFKYKTFGHANSEASLLELENLSDEVKLMTKCALNVSDEGDVHRRESTTDFNHAETIILPLALRFDTYRKMRHGELVRMVQGAYDDK